jgi:hypothetical protein
MHFLHAMREAIRRPEATVQTSIEHLSTQIIVFFKADYTEGHMPYVNRLMNQCLENLSLSGASNRAASTVLAALAENVPGMMALICGRLLALMETAEEKTNKNAIVGILITFRKIWPQLIVDYKLYTIRLVTNKRLFDNSYLDSRQDTNLLECEFK